MFLRLPGTCGWDPDSHLSTYIFSGIKELTFGRVYFLSPHQEADHERGHTVGCPFPAPWLGCIVSAILPELDAHSLRNPMEKESHQPHKDLPRCPPFLSWAKAPRDLLEALVNICLLPSLPTQDGAGFTGLLSPPLSIGSQWTGPCAWVLSHFSCGWLFMTLAFQAPLSMGFSRQEYGLPRWC